MSASTAQSLASRDGAFARISRSWAPPLASETALPFNQEQVELLGALTIAAASISIIAGSLSFYWFLRMRKAFRHHLIMLLILSNLWRALWYFIFPVASFASGGISSHSALCQVSGFMLSYGIEGADFVVLVMAVHAALSIFRTSATLGENGLYKMRHSIVALWLALPALAAGLAFLNHDGAYTSSGAYCYLPIRPFWYRLALSWIPRYLILIFIAATYLIIYLFVQRNFDHSQLSKHSSDKVPSGEHGQRYGRSAASTTTAGGRRSEVPTLNDIGLFKEAWPTVGHEDIEMKQKGAPAWEEYTFGAATPIAKPADHEIITTDPSLLIAPSRAHSDDVRKSTDSRESNSHIIQALRESNPFALDTDVETPISPTLRLTDSKNEAVEDSTMRARHRKIKRQMRFLFVYPVVYLITWIVPFVSHCLNYSNDYVHNPNFGLVAASTVILALQCTFDALLFTTREKPWQANDTDDPTARTFLGSLTPRSARRRFSRAPSQSMATNQTLSGSTANRSPIASVARTASSVFQLRNNSGDDRRTISWPRNHFHGNSAKISAGGCSRGQDVAEARFAHERKYAETADARETATERRNQRKESLARRGGHDRSWWEVEGRRRKDSVWLGTDAPPDVDKPTSPVTRARTTSSLEEIVESSGSQEQASSTDHSRGPQTPSHTTGDRGSELPTLEEHSAL